ncbi:hypothetical protein [Alkalicoccus urumqiensis]|uniref:Uncharacterized protein n=1 Tax=Alkalicoccus urumqiensis TaxID=1548213 RepID=A0A2P6MFL8_ALKUR|nr:hypothetical protein [Alkalicoccus urumqiensis]PRO65053.1 hypothetical protein C6I21_11440 [Alkalicoccus urumqiensis]
MVQLKRQAAWIVPAFFLLILLDEQYQLPWLWVLLSAVLAASAAAALLGKELIPSDTYSFSIGAFLTGACLGILTTGGSMTLLDGIRAVFLLCWLYYMVQGLKNRTSKKAAERSRV